MDIGMPDLNGMEATRQIVEAAAGARVIALSMHSDRRFIEGMFKAGAAGYLLKDAAFEELVRAVRTVVSGQTYLCPSVAGTVVGEYVNTPSGSSSPSSVLTPREREVLQLRPVPRRQRQDRRDLPQPADGETGAAQRG